MALKITIDHHYSSTDVVIEAENVKINEGISHSVYEMKEDGKPNYGHRIGDDIDDDAMKQFATVMEDITYYRESPFDSSSLIKVLFEKLPEDIRKKLLDELNNDYQDENTYTGEDVKVAFEDGKKYGDNELELDTAGRNSAFEVWHEDKFGFQYEDKS